MTQTSKYSEEVQKLVATIDEPDKDSQEHSSPDATQPLREIDVYIEDDRITFIPRIPAQEQVIDSVPAATPAATQSPQAPATQALEATKKPLAGDKESERIGYAILSFSVLFLLIIMMLQIYFLMNPPIATITIAAKSQQITLTGTLQLGRVIAPITLTQSQTVPTTGKGHQDARAATGTIMFYNGQVVQQTVPGGTIFTGAEGVKVATEQTITIPPGNPPTYGEATVAAHALLMGSAGNIPAGDITTNLAIAVFAKNSAPFHGGADERDFRTVTTNDLNEVTTRMKTTLAQSMQAALHSQVQSGEALLTLPCPPTVTADHHVGEEAVQLKVTVAETCSAVAYNSQELKGKVTDLLTMHAVQTLGTGYSLLGDVQMTVHQATGAPPRRPVSLSFVSQGTWVYALTSQERQHIKELIAGKSKRNALQLLESLPGIQSASIAWNEQTKLPNDMNALHLVILVEA